MPFGIPSFIEATRFELAASASRTQRSTKLSHASKFNIQFTYFREFSSPSPLALGARIRASKTAKGLFSQTEPRLEI